MNFHHATLTFPEILSEFRREFHSPLNKDTRKERVARKRRADVLNKSWRSYLTLADHYLDPTQNSINKSFR